MNEQQSERAPTAADVPLSMLFARRQEWLTASLLNLLEARTAKRFSNAHLNMFAYLNCGPTYSSDLAKQLGISRQAVYKTIKELSALGIVEQTNAPDRRNVKIITYTPYGESVIGDAIAALQQIETDLAARIGATDVEALKALLSGEWGEPLAATEGES